MTRPIRLAVVSDAVHPWHTGGKETRYEQLLKRLPGLNVEVTVYTMRWWDGDAPVGALKHRALSRRYEMYTDNRRSMLQGILFALSCFKLMFIGRYDVIEADHMPYLQLFPLRIVAWVRRVPLVVTWHEVWGPKYWGEYLGGVAGRIAAMIELLATKLPDHIVAVSTGTADRLNELGVAKSRVSVLWAGVNVEQLDSITAEVNAPEVLFAGRLLQHKRVDLVLDAIAQLRSEGSRYSVGIIGEGPERERLEALSTELGVSDQTTFLGALEEVEEVWAYMKGARVFAFPSEREGFGLAVAEALASGTPSVVVDHKSNASRELVDEGVTGNIITTGNVGQLAEAIRFWVEHPNEHHMQGLRFEERHPHLSWDGLAERYAALLNEVTR